jgi:DnaJ family protein B protein 12
MGGQPRAQAAGAPESRGSAFMQLLPLLLLLAFSVLNALPSLLSGPSYPDPNFSFGPSARYDTERFTANLGVRYHVNSKELRNHPVIGAEIARAASGAEGAQGASAKGLAGFEESIERAYTRNVRRCLRFCAAMRVLI